jgi:quercetin dioxygenase-like cupin family protein
MQVTRFSDARKYETTGHFDMVGLRLQGGAVSQTDGVTISLSYFLPGGGAGRSASPTEKYYIVLDGEVTVSTDEGEQTLGPLDSCHLAGGEARAILNRGNTVARMLVVIAAPRGEQ